jgi:tetrahydrodipicolinate N-succinyltransferase
VLQGCTVEDEAFVGMGATLLDGVVVGKHGMVAAGSLVRQNTRIPCGEVEHNFSTALYFWLLSRLQHSNLFFSFYFTRMVPQRQGFLAMMEPK